MSIVFSAGALTGDTVQKSKLLAGGRSCRCCEARIRHHTGSAWDRSGLGDKMTGWGAGERERGPFISNHRLVFEQMEKVR